MNLAVYPVVNRRGCLLPGLVLLLRNIHHCGPLANHPRSHLASRHRNHRYRPPFHHRVHLRAIPVLCRRLGRAYNPHPGLLLGHPVNPLVSLHQYLHFNRALCLACSHLVSQASCPQVSRLVSRLTNPPCNHLASLHHDLQLNRHSCLLWHLVLVDCHRVNLHRDHLLNHHISLLCNLREAAHPLKVLVMPRLLTALWGFLILK